MKLDVSEILIDFLHDVQNSVNLLSAKPRNSFTEIMALSLCLKIMCCLIFLKSFTYHLRKEMTTKSQVVSSISCAYSSLCKTHGKL